MITELLISNYRSLGPQVRFKPGRLTVLVGPNGSGKSNTLDVLGFLKDAVTLGLPAAITHRGGIESVRRRSHGHPFDLSVKVQLSLHAGQAVYGFVLTGDRDEEYKVKEETATVLGLEEEVSFQRGQDRLSGPEGLAPRVDDQSLVLTTLGGDPRFKELVDILSQLTVYSIFPDMLREPQRFDPLRPMKRHGENWVSTLREMVKSEARAELVKGLGKLTGDIEDVKVTSVGGHLVAEFKHTAREKKGKRWFGAHQQSDGTLRVAGLLTALLQTPPLPVVAIEEPELTVHPGALPLLYDYLRQACEVSQVLLTTHSPVILDVLDVERDTVVMAQRKRGKTTLHQVGEKQLEPVRRRLLSLGDLLLTGGAQLDLDLDDPAEDGR